MPNTKAPENYYRPTTNKKGNLVCMILALLGAAPIAGYFTSPLWSTPKTVQVADWNSASSKEGAKTWEQVAPGWTTFEQDGGNIYEYTFFEGLETLFRDANQVVLPLMPSDTTPEVLDSIKNLPWKDTQILSSNFLHYLEESAGKNKQSLKEFGTVKLAELPIQSEFIDKEPALGHLNAGQKIKLLKSLQKSIRDHFRDGDLRSGNFQGTFREALAKANGFDNLGDYNTTWEKQDIAPLVTTLVNNSPTVQKWPQASKTAYETQLQKVLNEALDSRPRFFTSSDNRSNFPPELLLIPGLLSLVSLAAFGLRKAEICPSDDSQKRVWDTFKLPLSLFKRLKNHHVSFINGSADDQQQSAFLLRDAFSKLREIEALIKQVSVELPEVQEHLKALQQNDSNALPRPEEMMRTSLESILNQILDEKHTVNDRFKGVREVPILTVARKLNQHVSSAAESFHFMPFLMPTEPSDITSLQKKKKLSFEEAKTLNRFELKKSQAILVSLAIGYLQAREAYAAQAEKLASLQEQVGNLAKEKGIKADIALVESHQTLANQEQATAVCKQRFDLYFELYTRSKLYFTRVQEKKNQLDVMVNKAAIKTSMGTLDQGLGKTLNYKLDDVDALLEEIQFKNLKEQVRIEIDAASIREKMLGDQALKKADGK